MRFLVTSIIFIFLFFICYYDTDITITTPLYNVYAQFPGISSYDNNNNPIINNTYTTATTNNTTNNNLLTYENPDFGFKIQ